MTSAGHQELCGSPLRAAGPKSDGRGRAPSTATEADAAVDKAFAWVDRALQGMPPLAILLVHASAGCHQGILDQREDVK